MAKAIPEGFSSVTPYLVVPDVKALIEFLTKAFDAKTHFKMEMPGGAIGHADMTVFGSHIMMGQSGAHHAAVPGMLYLYVEDCDAVHAKALAAGGILDQPVKDQFYGDRGGSVKDSNGNIWWIATRKEDLSAEDIHKRMAGAPSSKQIMPASVERIRADIEAIARCTATPGNGATRPTFSPAWGESRAYVIAQAEAAGCEVRTDAAGNVHARPRSLGWEMPAWLVGSHIDTVPHGGDYDGVAGVVVALELVRLALPVELIIFAKKEGPTFGLGMLGSRAWVGELSAEHLAGLKNTDGQTYLEAGASFGVDAPLLARSRFDRAKYKGLIEVHIEQGPGMWRRDQPLAIVRAIAGRRQYRGTVHGEANHAGATSMSDRKDALAGAAEMITALEDAVKQLSPDAVLTVGRLEVKPNAVNVIADRVDFTIDFRAPDDDLLRRGDAMIKAVIGGILEFRGLRADLEPSEAIPARAMDARLVDALSSHGKLPVVVSGALHDSAVLAPHLPTVMLFVPSKGGISHNPAEFSRVEDIALAANVVEAFVRRPSLASLNTGASDAFVLTCGPFFEHSPWVAERAWSMRPFTSTGQLHERMCGVVRAASPDEQLALLRAHPDLVGRLAREGALTRESTGEQAAAGLDSLSVEEITAFETHNAAYREQFGFPFIICARENRKDAILAAFPKRLNNTREQEITTALAEIDKIARLRMNDAIWED